MLSMPSEIVSDFISYLALDTASLQTCSLVCRSWVLPAQKHIFSKFTVQEKTTAARCIQLLEIFKDSPHLSSYFRHVDIECRIHDRARLLDSEYLHSILRSFSRVTALRLLPRSSGWAYSGLRWSDLPDDFLHSLYHLMSNTSFESLELRHWVFDLHGKEFIAFLKHCAASLQTLGLCNIRLKSTSENDGDGTGEVDDQPVDLPRLKEIRTFLGDSFKLINECLPVLRMPNLCSVYRDVHTTHACPHMDCYGLLIPSFPSTIPTWAFRPNLDYWQTYDVPTFCEAVDFHILDNLCDLRLVIDYWYLLQRQFTFFSLVKFFHDVPTHNLKHLSVIFQMGPDFDHSNEESFQANSTWELVANDLSPLLSAQALKQLSFVFKLRGGLEAPGMILKVEPNLDLKRHLTSSYDSVVRGSKVIMTRFRSLEKRGMLGVYIEETDEDAW